MGCIKEHTQSDYQIKTLHHYITYTTLIMNQNKILISELSFVCAFLILMIYPCILYCLHHSDYTFLLTTLLFALPLALLSTLSHNKTALTIISSIWLIGSIIETTMVVQFDSFIFAGNILAAFTTNAQEASGFLAASLSTIYYILPLILFYLAIIISIFKFTPPYITNWLSISKIITLTFVLLFVGIYIGYKQIIFYKAKLTIRYYIENRILNRPPYNLFYQLKNAILLEQRRQFIANSGNMTFNANKKDTISSREIYVLGIGESMRYENLSLNGAYNRLTTPLLEEQNNLVLYDNYYSSACLTMWSVPQILTRATPSNYELNFKEKSIFLPYKECGFKTFCIVNNNLLSYEKYLTAGMDSLIIVQHDSLIAPLIDSLSTIYPKTFYIFQLLGNHHPYYNYPDNYDIYRPNINSYTKADHTKYRTSAITDSLYINAYDNTILYTDYILSSIIKTIDTQDAVSSLIYVSDHGENISKDGGGHGGDCSPNKNEYHVPLIVWCSVSWQNLFPNKSKALYEHKSAPVNSDNIFYSCCDMANISINHNYSQPHYSIFSDTLIHHDRLLLLPDGVNTLKVE